MPAKPESANMLERAVATLTLATEAMVKATDERQLLDEICRLGVEVAGYRLAWIGYAHPAPAKTVTPVASAGPATAYLEGIRVGWGDDHFGRGPTGVAIRSGQPCIIADTDSDPSFLPWRERAAAHGIRSTATIPIGTGESRIGALMLYAAEPDAFDPLAMRLLSGLAGNLAHGVQALRIKADHDRAMRELADSEERYRSLIEMIPEALVVHAQGTIVYANPAARMAFCADPTSPLVGRPILDLVHADSRPVAVSRISTPPPGPYTGQYRLVTLDGKAFEAEVSACTISFRGDEARLVTIRDITQRTMMQEHMMQTTKLATLGEMAAGLVHELSQPLNIIRLAAEGALMLAERGKATPEWQNQQFALVAEQSERAAEIIDDIRIFSRRDTGPVQVFDAIAAVKGATEVLEGQMRADGIVLGFAARCDQAPVRGRKVQMEQVVINLLNNAHHALRDARDSHDKVWVGRIDITATLESDWLKLVVADNGPGIPAAIRSRIFEPFFTTKDAKRGTGLGLSVSFGLIAAMGGRLEIEDSREGAAFVIRLPLDQASLGRVDAAPIIAPPAAMGSFAESHILVVDDEPAAAGALGHYLRELGCRVSIAGTGEAAWSLFATDPADVVITDLRMPAGNGEQLVERLRDYDPLQPIIIVTGHLGATERVAANLEDDRCAVLKKPVALGSLGELIHKFLQPPSD
jgi:PAS domain S-box-containing protein